MAIPIVLKKYSVGVGDRFERQAESQLRVCKSALEQGTEIVPVWNKSNREHVIIGSTPAGTRAAADAAVQVLEWKRDYFVDADHIRLESVDCFIPYSDFYTIDVADCIGKRTEFAEVKRFVSRHAELARNIAVPALEEPLQSSQEALESIAGKYLFAIERAAEVFWHISAAKGAGTFVTEVSLDETDAPQTPLELLVLLTALADREVPVQTIAPRFVGSFHKGVDYVGDVASFERAFNQHLAVIAWAIERYGLPPSLKLSLHSGSDKFSIYPAIRRALTRFDAGLHLKTAGTTWLEELAGIAATSAKGLEFAKEITLASFERIDELCTPYLNVVAIEAGKLPPAKEVAAWSSDEFVSTLRHDQSNPRFNPDLRQLLHVAYKIAAERRTDYLALLEVCQTNVGKNVTYNLFERHLRPLFLD